MFILLINIVQSKQSLKSQLFFPVDFLIAFGATARKIKLNRFF